MASLFRFLRRSAHESPVYFYSLVIGFTGPAILAIVPPIRKRMGYELAEAVPTTYPVPKRERRSVSSEFDDPPPSKEVQEYLQAKEEATKNKFSHLYAKLPSRLRPEP
ncbi:hypothetical protein PIIN_00962 [Serendipita indica DSM 11827]|uniref:Uncharacterized protein n=1 Tax=Serendipita indica (strain DSM 11827) TaxID=1109443 RepID=G4T795_SERID|nr:hypothetical protein PIIN_00962 [Serendipita indica DSM 11827]